MNRSGADHAHESPPPSFEIGSAYLGEVPDDTAKDRDCLQFLDGLAPTVCAAWLRMLRCIRLTDRLAEHQRRDPCGQRFSQFVAAWCEVCAGRNALTECDDSEVLDSARDALFDSNGACRDQAALLAFNEFLRALVDYTCLPFPLDALGQHDVMLDRLSGNLFATFPYLTSEQRRSIRSLGCLDQCFNNLRDIAEDSEQGLCFFPEDVLRDCGLSRNTMLDGTAFRSRQWNEFVRFWLDDYVPSLRCQARAFTEAPDLHASVRAMRDDVLSRYARIERLFRRVGGDPWQFRAQYFERAR